MKKQEKQHSKLKIIPLGGLEQIGMNITAFEYEDSIIVVDCGLSFPEDDMYGVDLVIPDVTYLKDNIDRVKGFFITHAHEFNKILGNCFIFHIRTPPAVFL